MAIIDFHSHWGTRRGYVLQTEAELAQQRATWRSEPSYHTETEMAQYFRDNGVKAILDFGFTKFRPIEEMRALHDYAFETERAHRDVILGHWIHIDPKMGAGGSRVAALRRQSHRLHRLWRVRLTLTAAKRFELRPLLQAVHRGRHPGANLRRYDRPWA
jgi:hypothetical protein